MCGALLPFFWANMFLDGITGKHDGMICRFTIHMLPGIEIQTLKLWAHVEYAEKLSNPQEEVKQKLEGKASGDGLGRDCVGKAMSDNAARESAPPTSFRRRALMAV